MQTICLYFLWRETMKNPRFFTLSIVPLSAIIITARDWNGADHAGNSEFDKN